MRRSGTINSKRLAGRGVSATAANRVGAGERAKDPHTKVMSLNPKRGNGSMSPKKRPGPKF